MNNPKFKSWLKIISIGLIGSIIGALTKFPIGIMICTILLVGFVQFKFKIVSHLPVKIMKYLQLLIGISLGLNFNQETINVLKEIWLIALLMPLFHVILALILSYIMFRFLKINLVTILCSTVPAGIAEMIILAEKYGANMAMVSTMHIYRVIIIVTTIPPIIVFGM